VASRPCAKHRRFVKQCAGCVKKRETAQRASARSHEKRIGESFGISSADYEAMLRNQGGVCFICGRPPGRVRLAVDHDHELEAELLAQGADPIEARRRSIRGLLDKGCNYRVLGWLKDDPAALRRAIQYLKEPPARRILGS
jgi:recombination endonuclease VII